MRLEAVVRRCSVEKVFLKILQNSQEAPVPESLFKERLWQKETLAQMFFCEFCEIFKACVRFFLTAFYFSQNDSPSKTMKVVFYFI